MIFSRSKLGPVRLGSPRAFSPVISVTLLEYDGTGKRKNLTVRVMPGIPGAENSLLLSSWRPFQEPRCFLPEA